LSQTRQWLEDGTAVSISKDKQTQSLHELHQLIVWWLSRARKAQSDQEQRQAIQTAWTLWDRYWQVWKRISTNDQPQSQSPSTDILNAIINRWRLIRSSTTNRDPTTVLPALTQVWETVVNACTEFPSLVNDKTYAMLLSSLNPKADDEAILQTILQHYQDNPHTSTDNVIVWNASLKWYATVSNSSSSSSSSWSRLQRHWEDMMQHCQPDVTSYSTLLQAHAQQGRSDACLQLVSDMQVQEPPIIPNDVCYLHILQALVLEDKLDQAKDILMDLVNQYRQHCVENMDSSVVDTSVIIKPTQHLFSVVLSAYAKQGHVSKVQEILQALLDLHKITGDPDLEPKPTVLNSSLLAVQIRQPETAQTLLLDTLYPHGVADTASFNTVLQAWAESDLPHAVDRAEDLLRIMIEATSHGLDTSSTGTDTKPAIKPNVISYTTVMKAWARSDRKGAPERCEAFLKAMYQHNVQPNSVTYATAIYAWSRAKGNKQAPFRAEAIFHDQMERYKNGSLRLKPTEATYVALMNTWNRSNSSNNRNKKNTRLSQKTAARVQYYFDQIRTGYLAGDESLRPTIPAYYALMESKKRAGDGRGADNVLQMVLDELKQNDGSIRPQDRHSVRPHRNLFYSAMSAWANSGYDQAPERVEALMYQLRDMYNMHGWEGCKPRSTEYLILMNCWARSGREEAPEQTEAMLRELQSLAKEDTDGSMKISSNHYFAVFDAWVRSGRPEAPDKVQSLIEEMTTLYEGGNKECRPNSSIYASLIAAWCKSKHPDATLRALATLNEMEERFRFDPSNEKPDTYHYSAVINAFAERGLVDEAHKLLSRLLRNPDVSPNTSCFNGLLKAIVRANKSNAGEQAEQIFHLMQEHAAGNFRHLRPDGVSYYYCVKAWQQSANPEAVDRAQAVLDKMVNDHLDKPNAFGSGREPTEDVFASFLQVLSHQSVNNKRASISEQEAKERTDQVLDWMNSLGIRPSKRIFAFIEQCRKYGRNADIEDGTIDDEIESN